MLANPKKDPVITVIMPVYNVQAYIEEAVSSVLAQTHRDFELLVVDDASPDESIALIESKFSDQRIRIISQENRGLAGARNTGIREARGKYQRHPQVSVGVVDAEDVTRLLRRAGILLPHKTWERNKE